MSDLIYRQDVVEAIKVVLDDGGEWFIEAINDIPSAGQNCIFCEYYTEIETDDGIKGECTKRTGSEPKTGEWIKSNLLPNGWNCDNCGSPIMTDDIGEMLYCPNCGTRMTPYKGGEDE